MNHTYGINYSHNINNLQCKVLTSEMKKGYLIVSETKKWLWLKNDRKETIRSGAANDELIARISVGNNLFVGGFDIKLIKLINSSFDTSNKDNNNNNIKNNNNDNNNTHKNDSNNNNNNNNEYINKENINVNINNETSISIIETISSSSSSSIPSSIPSSSSSSFNNKRKALNELDKSKIKDKKKYDCKQIFNENSINNNEDIDYNLKSEVELDPLLKLKMRPHQIEGAMFILDILLGKKIINNNIDNDLSLDISVMNGAILADEMGTGKTLTSLSVLWSLCRHGRCKGIIVCPKSLLGNWEAEINKWLPSSLARTALYVRGNGSGQNGPDVIVNRFITSHASVHPVLVINYEMFRSFADALNTINTLEVLICDEGHRLKNAYGNKTSLALGNSIATKRLVLSGTPIQNNLEELYAVVQFVSPGFLGTLTEFKLKYADIISKSRETTASELQKKKGFEAASKLKRLLSYILLRRTQDSVLGSILPPRTDFTIHCYLENAQKKYYIDESNKILDNLIIKSEVSDDLNYTEQKHKPITGVLPNLLKLRLICNDSSIISTNDDNNENTISGKLAVLENMLLSIKRIGSEKVVVVSNFMTTLDKICNIGKSHKWSMLRLDGSVQPDKRMKIVQHFNNPTTDFFILLLSAKAGGVGLNLTGASRLILFEPDWNPAIDLQAMGRIWRDGQTKPVFIYRLICNGTIEESILNRQKEKNDLTIVIKESKDNNNDNNNNNDEPDIISQYISNVDVKSLIIPSGFDGLNNNIINNDDINDDDIVSDKVLVTMKKSNIINQIHNITKTGNTK